MKCVIFIDKFQKSHSAEGFALIPPLPPAVGAPPPDPPKPPPLRIPADATATNEIQPDNFIAEQEATGVSGRGGGGTNHKRLRTTGVDSKTE